MERLVAIRGPDHQQTLNQMEFLSHVHWEMGNNEEAERLNAEVVNKQTRILGPEHPDTLVSRRHSAHILSELGNDEEAAVREQDILASCERVFGKDHPETIGCKWSLAQTCMNVPDRWEEADKLSLAAMDASAIHLGPLHKTTLESMDTRMRVLLQLDRPVEVIGLGAKMLETARQALPRGTKAIILNTLGAAYIKREDYEQAKPLIKEALDIRQDFCGPSDQLTIESKQNLAACFANLEQLEAARELEEDLLNTCGQAYGDTDALTIECMINLATTLWDLDDYAAAE